MSAAEGTRRQEVLLVAQIAAHGETNHTYMLAPVMRTLRCGSNALPFWCPPVASGRRKAYLTKLVAQRPDVSGPLQGMSAALPRCNASVLLSHVPLGAACTFVWIGEAFSRSSINLAQLRPRCTTINYQTEPDELEGHAKSRWNGVWSYTRKHSSSLYAPPRYDPSAPAVTHEDTRPIFVGFWKYRSVGCELVRNTPSSLRMVEYVWSDEDLTAAVGNGSIFVNIHKQCSAPQPPLESLRVSQLLSRGALIVSQRSWHADEAEFEGLVDFVDDSLFWGRVNELAALAVPQRQAMAQERVRRFARWHSQDCYYQAARHPAGSGST